MWASAAGGPGWLLWMAQECALGRLDIDHPYVRWQHTVDQLSRYVPPRKLVKPALSRASHTGTQRNPRKRATVGIG